MQIERDLLLRSLSFVYRVVVASEALLEFAIPKATGELRCYYERHLEEERGHDRMLLDDLHRLGVDSVPRSHLAAQLAGSQYYLIAHDDPALLLGYMRALEHGEMTPETVDDLSRQHGTELTALKHHASHDPLHRKDIDAMIAKLAPQMRERVEWNERNVKQLIGRMND